MRKKNRRKRKYKKQTIDQFMKEMDSNIAKTDRAFEPIELTPLQHGFNWILRNGEKVGKKTRVRHFENIQIDNFPNTIAQELKTLHKKRNPFVIRKGKTELFYQYGRNPTILLKNGKFYTQRQYADKRYRKSRRWTEPRKKAEHQSAIILLMLRKLGYVTFERKG